MKNRLIRIFSLALIGLILVAAIEYVMASADKRAYDLTFTDIWTGVLACGIIVGLMRRLNHYLDRYIPWDRQIWKRAVIQLSSNLLMAVILVSVAAFVIAYFFTRNSDFVRFNWPQIAREMLLFNIISVLGVGLFVLYDGGRFFFNRWKDSLVQLARFEKENVEFRFAALRNQVNPHFLFNSLNTLSSMIHSDPDAASQFVRQLSRVYRYVLENKEKEVIPLAEELTVLSSYLFLIAHRFKDQVKVEINIPESDQAAFIPPMTLQMLIENAIKHNSTSREKPLHIHVFSDQDFLVVSNPIQARSSVEFSSQVGLANISSRFAFLSDVPVQAGEENGAFVVRLPWLKEMKA
ncbi:MAG: histidine kinase [Bacteroidota bacterium]